MSGNAILVDNISKRYLIPHSTPEGRIYQYTALRDVIVRELSNIARTAADVVRGHQVVSRDKLEEFWALKNVSFEVKQGQVLGVVGRNGGGKSTLLKILGRITKPTTGRVRITGRVATLLDVGTGFHPELTGKENIFLNGAILGMPQQEIRRKYDEIVAFAELEKFLDMPVKHYSSGMYVRLAFAVAAHLEPEILLVDEVLAVGDAGFQRKCLGKINDVSHQQGRTVLLVTHDMRAVKALCQQALVLDHGSLIQSGSPDEIIRTYLAQCLDTSEQHRVVTPLLRWHGLQNRAALENLRNDEDLVFELGFESGSQPINNLQFDCSLTDEHGRTAVHCRSKFVRGPISIRSNTRFVVRYLLRSPRLAPGHYYLGIYVAADMKELCWIEHIDACGISTASPFFADAVLDGVKGSSVPDFMVEAMPDSTQ